MTQQRPLILIVDDESNIHNDYQNILRPDDGRRQRIRQLETILFGESSIEDVPGFDIDHAYQGQDAVEKVRQALDSGSRYALAFVDIRMPPGWNGIETIARMWELDPELRVVISTAYSDFSWDRTVELLGKDANLRLLRKPFTPHQVRDLVAQLCDQPPQAKHAVMLPRNP